jgi:type I restriction-modification system DNA methylase subunit
MTRPERQQTVLDILKDFRGPEPLKQLFWSELNYSRLNTPLSRRGWNATAADSLAADPVLFATGGDGFHIIHSRLPTDKLLMGQERPVVSQLLKEHPYALFVFSNHALNRWHFLNVKYDEEITKRRVFRRITVGPEERLRTASERIAMLDLESVSADLFGLAPLAIQKRHDEAFDVEPVTTEFFKKYASVFEEVEKRIEGIKDKERRRLFTQRLFNRLMFVAFIQKKGWLKFGKESDYLAALWQDYEKNSKSKGRNFYNNRLKLLFFSGLSTPNEVNVIGINRGGFLKELIGQVPYLNGGLFEEDDDDRDAKIVVPDECVKAILQDLFSRFNFTVTESTPLDIEVAVDPEMLGKIFEELVTGRHETGSYYTPKPVVSFMCREALKGYLGSQLPLEATESIERFVEEHHPEGLKNPEPVLEALRKVRVCDPACGSGAYLLGMLHELIDLRGCLFATHKLDAISNFTRKLEIIQNNVYGVDLDPFAVNIARLRLWLSLAVEYEGNNPPPLPNLDFKIEAGDSLTAPDPSGGLEQGFRKSLIDEYLKLKAEFLTAHHSRKIELRKQIDKHRETIRGWAHAGGAVDGFDWPVEFAEVFIELGFDAVLANPPYVRADAQFKHLEDEKERQRAISDWKGYRAALLEREIYSTLYEKWDLYLPFLERGYQLLRPEGGLVFIISDAYNAAKYARKAREFFLKSSRVERIDFCTDIPLFDAGVSNTILHLSKSKPGPAVRPARARRWGNNRDQFEQNVESLPTAPQAEFGAAVFRPDGEKPVGPGDGSVPLEQLVFVSVGMVINANERGYLGAFGAEDLLSNRRDREHPKSFVFGKDIESWHLRNLRYLEWNTQRAPARFRRPTFPELHEAPEKLLAVRTPGSRPKVTYDNSRVHFDASSVGFVPWHLLKGIRNRSIQKSAKYSDEVKPGRARPVILRDELERRSSDFDPKYLLAIMNSELARNWLSKRRRSKVHVYPDDWKGLPVKAIPLKEQQRVVRLVDAILREFEVCDLSVSPQSARRIAELESEINERVAALYGL